MHKLQIPAILLFTSLFLGACKKKSVDPVIIPAVQSITGVYNGSSSFYGPQINFTITEDHIYHYNSNNQLIRATKDVYDTFSFTRDHSTKGFTYTDGLLTKTDLSDYTREELVYNGQKQLITQNFYGPNDQLSSICKLAYNSNGSLATYTFSNGIIDGVIRDPWTCVYNYGADGLLANIVINSSLKPNVEGTVYFTGYSDECDFDPLVMGDIVYAMGLSTEAGLGASKRLPLSANYIFADGTGGDYYTYSYTINNRRLEKITRTYYRIGQDKTITDKNKYDFTFTY